MAWDEWEQLKAAAAQKHATHTQLNEAAVDSGGGGGSESASEDLVVHQDDLGAVGHEAFVLHDHLRKQTDIAAAGSGHGHSGSTMKAAASLTQHHFDMGSAVERTVDVWTVQVKTVLQAIAQISNHLDYTKKLHRNDDEHIAADLRHRDGSPETVSHLNDYFD